MSTKKGRPVTASFKKFDGRNVVSVTEPAQFHCWGVRKLKNGVAGDVIGVETVAVCELPSGGVKLVHPERIQFTDIERPKK